MIRFYNTNNLVVPLLDYILVHFSKTKIEAHAYISQQQHGNISEDKRLLFKTATLTMWTKKSKGLNHIMYALSACFKILFAAPDLNVFFTQPPLFAIIASRLSQLRGTPYVLHIMDLYPDLLAKLGYLKEEGFIYKWLDNTMIKSLQRAEHVIVPGRCMKEYLIQKGISSDKIDIIINVPSAQKEVTQTSQLITQLNLRDDDIVLLYAGNLGIAHDLTTLIKSSGSSKIKLVIVGQGHRLQEVTELIQEREDIILIKDRLDISDFSALVNRAQFHFITLREDYAGLMVPSKVYSSLASGTGIIYEGASTSEIGLIIKEAGCGFVIDPKNHQSLSEVLDRIVSNPAMSEELGAHSIDYYNGNCNVEDIVTRCCDIYTQVII